MNKPPPRFHVGRLAEPAVFRPPRAIMLDRRRFGPLWPRQPVGRTAAVSKTEESPGSIRMRRRITSGGGDPRESATESKPPDRGRKAIKRDGKGERVR